MDVDVVRVFTRDGEGGNHLGIVPEILGADRMQSIAAAVGFSETIFVDPAPDDPPVRIFTPMTELPFAGHPLVGVAWWLGHHGNRATALVTGIGRVHIRPHHDTAEVVVDLGQPVEPDAPVPEGLTDVIDCAVVAMPLPYVLCELPGPEAVAAVTPDPAWGHVYVYARLPGHRFRARFLAGGLGVTEDPATGSAAVALAARLAAAGQPDGHALIDQGEEMGHPSRLAITWGEGAATLSGSVVAEDPITVD